MEALNGLGQFPLLQLAGFIVILAGGYWAIKKGNRDHGSSDDLPLNTVYLRDSCKLLERMLDKLEGVEDQQKTIADRVKEIADNCDRPHPRGR